MKRTTIPAIACAVAMGCTGGFAAEYFVAKDGGSDSYDGKAAEWDGTHGPKRTIQAAVDLTNPAGKDIVTVLPGVYDEGSRVSPAYSDHEFRVVMTNHLLLRSRDGAAKTIIKGALGSGADNLGPGAIRGVYMRGFSYSAIEGFTITGCATTNTVKSGNGRFGAAVVGSWNQYVLGCIISNNYAVEGAGIYNCNGVRSLFTANKVTGTSAAGRDSWFWNCAIANN